MPYAGFGPNDNQEDAPHFTIEHLITQSDVVLFSVILELKIYDLHFNTRSSSDSITEIYQFLFIDFVSSSGGIYFMQIIFLKIK